MTDNIESKIDNLPINSTCVRITNMYSNVIWVHNVDFESEANLKSNLVNYIATIDNVSPELIKLTLIKDNFNYKALYSYFLR